MKYKTYNCNSFNVHTIKTDKFKTCHMEIIFRNIAEASKFASLTMLGDFLTDSCKKYPTRRDVVIRLEELYKAVFYGVTTKVGQTVVNNFVYDFISPKYIEEENYLEEILSFPFEMLQNPNASNETFDIKYFNIVKKRLEKDIMSIKDDAMKLSINQALKAMDPESPSSFMVTGTLEDLESITPSTLYKEYKKMLKESNCDIFIIGDLDMDEVVNNITKLFKKRVINCEKLAIDVDNKIRKKVNIVRENSEFSQANLNVIYNLVGLDSYEKNVVFHIFNQIFGNGGLTSKLYQDIRQKNSLCYAIDSLFLKYDNLLLIHVSLDSKNVDKCVKLIKKNIKNMIDGKFSSEDVADAISNMEVSINLTLDNQISILDNYVFYKYYDLPLLEERLELYKKVTKEDIIKVAKKIKLNTIYVLEGGSKNEGN